MGRSRSFTAVGAVALAFLGLAATADAAVTVSEDASTIFITGTGGADGTTVVDGGSNVVVSQATAVAPCTQSGTDAVCARGTRTISASLAGGPDSLNSQSAADASISGGDGDDTLTGRLRAVLGGAGMDTITPSGMSGTVTLQGEGDYDTYDIGTDTGASDLVSDSGGGGLVDYLSRPSGSGGVSVTLADSIANDGAVGEFDNVGGSGVGDVRGTNNGDSLTGTDGANVITGALGADVMDARSGDDRLESTDNILETVFCGDGRDIANSDPADTLVGCEVADGDRDGVDDTLDACRLQTGAGTSSGCPLAARTIRLRYLASKSRFAGHLASREPACLAGKRVSIFRRVKGRDPRVARATTSAKGIFSKRKRVPDGAYYAAVDKEVLPNLAECGQARSRRTSV
jgi:hypothetical protein